MDSPSVQVTGISNRPLLSLPSELVTKAFCLLPSFSDVLALTATCSRLRHIWTTNTTTIYRQVAPRSIPCEPYARSLLADQGSPARDSSTMSAGDVNRMLRNSRMIEKEILQFEEDIVRRVRSTFYAPVSMMIIDSNEIYSQRHKSCRTRRMVWPRGA